MSVNPLLCLTSCMLNRLHAELRRGDEATSECSGWSGNARHEHVSDPMYGTHTHKHTPENSHHLGTHRKTHKHTTLLNSPSYFLVRSLTRLRRAFKLCSVFLCSEQRPATAASRGELAHSPWVVSVAGSAYCVFLAPRRDRTG